MHRLLLGLTTLAIGLCAAPAAHAAGWASTGPLSPEGRIAANPVVALTPSGGRVVAWTERAAAGGVDGMFVRVAPPGGDFGPAQKFDGVFFEPRLVAGSDGTVALVDVDSVTRTVRIARLAPGNSTFTLAPPINPAAPAFSGVTDVAVSRGDVYVSLQSVDQSGSPTTSSIWEIRLPAGADAAQVVPGAAAGGAIDRAAFTANPRVFVEQPAMDVDDGRITIAWEATTSENGNANATTTLKFAQGNAGGIGAATPITTLTSNDRTFPPTTQAQVAAGGGHAYVVFVANRSVVYKDVPAGPILTVPTDTTFPGDLDAHADAAGGLVAAWDATVPDHRNDVIVGVTVPAGANPPLATRITQAGPGRQLADLAVASDGTALALPDHASSSFDSTLQIDGSLRPGGGTFGPPEAVSGLQDSVRFASIRRASAAVAPGGRAVAAWASSDDSSPINQRIHVSERDTTPPVLGTIAVPATATVGEHVGFAATAGDVLSGTTISWDFGDGSQADGGVVDHVYGQPGPAVVTITATDEAGNSTSEQRVIAVQPAPGGPAGPDPDRTPPVISKAGVTNKRFRVSRRATAQIAGRKQRTPAGTVLRLTLSERATLAVSIERSKVVRGTLVRASAGPGGVTIPFSGRIGRRALPPGSYLATVTAVDGAGNRSKPVHVRFTIAK